tara:strand:- start:211 stop:918 length:708 start_codon:yes stop_codon:yes gene_type:complete
MKLPAILKNKYVLYAVLFFAITNVLGFLQRNDFESLTIFVAIGLLSTHFSKNMTVNLLVAMIGANVIKGSGFIREGMTGDSDETPPPTKPEGADEVAYKLEGEKCVKCTDSSAEGCNFSDAKCKTEKAGFSKSNVPSSKPASVDGGEDEAVGKRIDYAATLEQAYDNLEKMLGSDGLKGLTDETKQLVGQQQNLMKTLNNMAPILNNAKGTLENLNMPNMDKLKEVMSTFQGSKK